MIDPAEVREHVRAMLEATPRGAPVSLPFLWAEVLASDPDALASSEDPPDAPLTCEECADRLGVEPSTMRSYMPTLHRLGWGVYRHGQEHEDPMHRGELHKPWRFPRALFNEWRLADPHATRKVSREEWQRRQTEGTSPSACVVSLPARRSERASAPQGGARDGRTTRERLAGWRTEEGGRA